MGKLLHSEQQLLADWAIDLHGMFGKEDFGPYQVGSSLDATKQHRDIDVRVMLPSERFKELQNLISIDRLNLTVSLWGQQVTGLPIDFQVQDQDYANKHHEGPRSAIFIRGIAKGDGYDNQAKDGV